MSKDDGVIDSKMTRTNTKIISSEAEPLWCQCNTIVMAERVSEKGLLYGVATYQMLAANGYMAMQITNPANSNKVFYIETLTIGSSTNTTFSIQKNGATTVAGTPLTPVNRNWSYGNNSVATAKYVLQATDPTTTAGAIITAVVEPGGAISREYGGQLIIPSSSSDLNYYILVINNSNQSNNVSISTSWWELPTGIFV